MSSTIRITRICEFCHQEFEAKTTNTKYCSHACNCKAYDQIKRNEKIEQSNAEVIARKIIIQQPELTDFTILKDKELLTIKDACILLNITHVTLRRWIKSKIITTTRIGKKHIIHRSHLDGILLK